MKIYVTKVAGLATLPHHSQQQHTVSCFFCLALIGKIRVTMHWLRSAPLLATLAFICMLALAARCQVACGIVAASLPL